MSIDPLQYLFSQPQFVSMAGGTAASPADAVANSPRQNVDAASWLDQQRKVRLSSQQDVITFATAIYNSAAQSLPGPEDLLKIIDTLHAQAYPHIVDTRTNPQSQTYPTVLSAIDPLLNVKPLRILYFNPIIH